MNADTPLFARARLQMPNAAGYVRWLIEHLQQEGVQVVPGDSTDSLRLQMDSVGTLELQALADDALDCQIWPVDAPMLALVKMSLIEHAQEFLAQHKLDAQAIHIEWDDSGAEDAQARPGLQRLRVLGITNITPRMRRFRLQVENLQALLLGGLHVRLLLPEPHDSAVIWPSMGSDGRLQYSEASHPGPSQRLSQRLPQRIYTIVHSDAQNGWLEIDMLRHGEAVTHTSAPGVSGPSMHSRARSWASSHQRAGGCWQRSPWC